jgi:hypothetical protein
MMYEGGFRNVLVENGQPIGMVSARDALGSELKSFISEMDQREHIVVARCRSAAPMAWRKQVEFDDLLNPRD